MSALVLLVAAMGAALLGRSGGGRDSVRFGERLGLLLLVLAFLAAS